MKMRASIEEFINCGGEFEIQTYSTYLLFGKHRMRIPNHYFTTENLDEIEVLDYYLKMIVKCNMITTGTEDES